MITVNERAYLFTQRSQRKIYGEKNKTQKTYSDPLVKHRSVFTVQKKLVSAFLKLTAASVSNAVQPFSIQMHLKTKRTSQPMKNLSLTFLIVLILGSLQSCTDKYTETYQANVPEYMSLETWRAMDIAAETPRDLREPGKIYIYQNYLFIVERGEGIHIFDNANPSSPQNMAFLSIAGCVDLAVRNHILYADAYYDLLAFDISDPAHPALSCRVPNAFDFSNWTMVKGYDESLPFIGIDPAKGVITGWTQQEISRDAQPYQSYMYEDIAWSNGGLNEIGTAVGNISGNGMGGSMAQFTVSGDYLYVLRPSSITSFDLSGNNCPQQSSVTNVGWNAETIFPYNNHLFLGTSSGMIIYNLNNPAAPEYVSQISHITSCDPVAVQGNRAYATIRTGTGCGGFTNGLLVIDITDYTAPTQLAQYDLTNPHGIGIDGNTLFICDGTDGLKVFDAENDLTITDHLISHYQNIETYDVIPFNHVLIMSAKEGIYQYDYSDPNAISELSLIPAH